MDGIVEVCDVRNSVGFERDQGMCQGIKEGNWMEKWIWSVWDVQMIQKHEYYNPEHKNKGFCGNNNT